MLSTVGTCADKQVLLKEKRNTSLALALLPRGGKGRLEESNLLSKRVRGVQYKRSEAALVWETEPLPGTGESHGKKCQHQREVNGEQRKLTAHPLRAGRCIGALA